MQPLTLHEDEIAAATHYIELSLDPESSNTELDVAEEYARLTVEDLWGYHATT